MSIHSHGFAQCTQQNGEIVLNVLKHGAQQVAWAWSLDIHFIRYSKWWIHLQLHMRYAQLDYIRGIEICVNMVKWNHSILIVDPATHPYS